MAHKNNDIRRSSTSLAPYIVVGLLAVFLGTAIAVTWNTVPQFDAYTQNVTARQQASTMFVIFSSM